MVRGVGVGTVTVCIQIDEFCIQSDGFCIQSDGFDWKWKGVAIVLVGVSAPKNIIT